MVIIGFVRIIPVLEHWQNLELKDIIFESTGGISLTKLIVTNFHKIVINFLGSKLLYIACKVKISNNFNDLSKTLTKSQF